MVWYLEPAERGLGFCWLTSHDLITSSLKQSNLEYWPSRVSRVFDKYKINVTSDLGDKGLSFILFDKSQKSILQIHKHQAGDRTRKTNNNSKYSIAFPPLLTTGTGPQLQYQVKTSRKSLNINLNCIALSLHRGSWRDINIEGNLPIPTVDTCPGVHSQPL